MAPTPERYTIAERDNRDSLVWLLDELAAQGWRPVGGITNVRDEREPSGYRYSVLCERTEAPRGC